MTNEAALARKDAPVDMNVLLLIVFSVGIIPPFS
jgi:hypothetical protein